MHLRVVTSSLVYDIRLRSSSVSAMEYRDSQSGFKVRSYRSPRHRKANTKFESRPRESHRLPHLAFEQRVHIWCLSFLLSTSLTLLLPPNQPPSNPNHPHSTHQQPNTRRITNTILWPKPRLINLRPNNPHQLRARIRDPNRKTRRRSSMRSADSLWP